MLLSTSRMGYIILYLEGDPDGCNPVAGQAYISELYVNPEARRSGLGACLVDLAVYIAAMNEKGVCLDSSPFESDPNNPEQYSRDLEHLRSWYRRQGFELLPGNRGMFKPLNSNLEMSSSNLTKEKHHV